MNQRRNAEKIRQTNEFLSELVNEMEQARQHYGTTDLETIAALCAIPHGQLQRLLELLGPMISVAKTDSVAGEYRHTANDRWLLSEQEQQLIQAWRDAAAKDGDELSISQDLVLEFPRRRY